jgi:hypothetical protein
MWIWFPLSFLCRSGPGSCFTQVGKSDRISSLHSISSGHRCHYFDILDSFLKFSGKSIVWLKWNEFYGSGSARLMLIRPDRIHITASTGNATYHLQPTLPACCWRYSSCTCTSMLSLPSSTWYLPVSVSRLTSQSVILFNIVRCRWGSELVR